MLTVERPRRGATDQLKKELSRRYARAAAKATDKAAVGARDDIRANMRAQRLGGLANVIGSTSDLKKQRAPRELVESFDVAGFVFARIGSPRTQGALESYLDNDTTTITPAKGRWLAIATNEIPQRAGRQRMTPALYRSKGFESRIGRLRFQPSKKPGQAFLVVDTTVQRVRPGKARAVPKSGRISKGRIRGDIIAFVLIRVTRRQRRIDVRSIGREWAGKLPDLISDELA